MIPGVMGSSYAMVKETLLECKGNLEEAVEKLLSGIKETELGIYFFGGKIIKDKFHGKSLGFVEGLYVCVQNALGNYTQYCCVCNTKHSCNRFDQSVDQALTFRMSEKPVVCSQPLCMFRYEELGVGVKVGGISGVFLINKV